MRIITIGKEFKGKYDFRETCFGIVENDNKLLVVNKNNQYSLIGGGIEANESFKQCLEREFLEESGYSIKSFKELVQIDCYWLAAEKYPLLSRANIFEIEVDFDRKKEATEDDCYLEWIDINEAIELMPLPYHKKAMEFHMKKKGSKE